MSLCRENTQKKKNNQHITAAGDISLRCLLKNKPQYRRLIWRVKTLFSPTAHMAARSSTVLDLVLTNNLDLRAQLEILL